MHSLTFIQRSFVAVALLWLAGCGGSNDKTCTDACNTLFTCAAKLNQSPATFMGSDYQTVESCIARCTTGSCAKKQQLLNCSAGLQCNDFSQVQTDLTACFVSSDCSP